jgi:hypothetical protein
MQNCLWAFLWKSLFYNYTHNNNTKDSSLLGCNTVQLGVDFSTFRRLLMSSSSAFGSWKWRNYDSSKHQKVLTQQHSVISHNILKFSNTTVRTSYLATLTTMEITAGTKKNAGFLWANRHQSFFEQCPSWQSLYQLNETKEDYKMEKSVMVREKGLQDAYLCVNIVWFSNILMHSSFKVFSWIFLTITESKHFSTTTLRDMKG